MVHPELCSVPSFDLRSAIFPRGRYEVPIRAASAKLAVSAYLTCSLPTEQVRRISFVYYKVTTLVFGRLFFYSESTFGFGSFFVFLNEEYLIALVDFIAPCGGTKGQGRRDLRIPPSLSSGL